MHFHNTRNNAYKSLLEASAAYYATGVIPDIPIAVAAASALTPHRPPRTRAPAQRKSRKARKQRHPVPPTPVLPPLQSRHKGKGKPNPVEAQCDWNVECSELSSIQLASDVEMTDVDSAPQEAHAAFSRNTISSRDKITSVCQARPRKANRALRANFIDNGVQLVLSDSERVNLPLSMQQAMAELEEADKTRIYRYDASRASPDINDPDVPTIPMRPYIREYQNANGVWVTEYIDKMVDHQRLEVLQRAAGRMTLGPQGTLLDF